MTTLNSKYIHSNLAIRYLYSYSKELQNNIYLQEFTINNNEEYIIGEIFTGNYDIVCFSCYIWNVSKTLKLAKTLKKIKPDLIIIFGGPEVSYNSYDLIEDNKYIDCIIIGEGEITFKELMDYLICNIGSLRDIKGIIYRYNNSIIKNNDRELIKNLDVIPFPYKDDEINKIVYYESSRGCPFNCSYCLSSTIRGVRFFSLDRVKEDLKYFIDKKVRQVKFVDRTFNIDIDRSIEIMKYIKENDNGCTNFHFEITADLLNDKILEFIKEVRAGLFQFEIGVQTTCINTLKSVNRNVNFEILSDVVKKLYNFRNMHLHLDLITGLPYESYERFSKSFNDVYRLKPDNLQLGFLKLLKGSKIRNESEIHEYVFDDEPPYEVISNKYISFEEILMLKKIEDILDKYFNAEGFTNSIKYIIDNYFKTPFELYEDFAIYWHDKGLQHVSHSKISLYKIIIDYYKHKKFSNVEFFIDLLKYDYLLTSNSKLPKFLENEKNKKLKNYKHEFLKDENNLAKYIPNYINLPVKDIIKSVHFEVFEYDIIEILNKKDEKNINKTECIYLFDYKLEDTLFTKSKAVKISGGINE